MIRKSAHLTNIIRLAQQTRHPLLLSISTRKNSNISHENMEAKIRATEYLRAPLKEIDPEIHNIILAENKRQKEGLELIASENFTSCAVMDAIGNCLNDKYSEGYIGARYYGGTQNVDSVEGLCIQRALEAYNLSADEWGVNVQPYSGSPANFAVFTGVVGPHGRIMGLDLPDGGHLTHGFYTPTRKVSATSIFFESFPYNVDPKTGLIDYDTLEENAIKFRPKIIIAGMSCYARNIDYARMRQIADKCGALLHADMAHISGLVAAGCVPSPFEHCDIVTTTTHKTLRGPRSGIIFYRVGTKKIDQKTGQAIQWDLKKKIDEALFPGLQGGPHNHAIAGVAVALKLANTQQFKEYTQQVCKNAQVLANTLKDVYNYELITGGTDNHLMLVNLVPAGTDGNRVQALFDKLHITANKNTIPGDKSAMRPSGMRLGTPALTSRGMDEKDMEKVAQLIDQGIKLSARIKKSLENTNNFKEYKEAMNGKEFESEIEEIASQVQSFAREFPIPGKVYDE